MVTIVNETTGAVVAANAAVARGVVARTRGLMFRKSLREDEALVIDPCSSIHMMWMRFPIDAVFYNCDGIVTKVAKNVRPWVGFAFGGRGSRAVIEMPVGAAAGIEPGHRLAFRD